MGFTACYRDSFNIYFAFYAVVIRGNIPVKYYDTYSGMPSKKPDYLN
jgi:hypothetical protein